MKRGTTLIEAVEYCEAIYAKVLSTDGFAYQSKAAKKEDVSYLSATYDMVRGDKEFSSWEYDRRSAEQSRLIAEAGLVVENLEQALELQDELSKIANKIKKSRRFDVPMELRHVRVDHIKNIFSLFSQDVGYLVERLAVILGAVNSTEVSDRKESTLSPEQRALNAIGVDKSRFADRNLIKEAYAVYRELDEEGRERIKSFRSQHIVDVDLVNVTNEFGTRFQRHMFFLNYKREAFAVVMSFIEKDYDFWMVNGMPAMDGMTREQVKEFYKGAA